MPRSVSAVQPIRPAATVIIAREGDSSGEPEIFMLRRTNKAAFAGGMYVFPGGRVDSDDHLHKYDSVRVGPLPSQHLQQQALIRLARRNNRPRLRPPQKTLGR